MRNQKLWFMLVFIFTATALSAQHTGWLRDLKLAQNVAEQKKQLILVDFWATWCGPCKMMDADVWSTAEAEEIKKNFVPVKIDIDAERSLAMKYNVKSIPMLILMTHKGEPIHTYTGYKGKEDLMQFISKIPANAESIYKTDKKDETFEQSLLLGLAMQDLSQQTTYEPLKRSFLNFSDKSFKRANKLAGSDATKSNEIELLTNLNKVYRNSAKKVIKEIEENRTQYESTSNVSLMYYVLAQAYKSIDDTAGYEFILSKLREQQDSQKYLSLLK